MPSLYEYLKLILCTCVTTLATDSPTKIPALHHKNLLKHRVPPPDSVFDYGALRTCKDDTGCLFWQICATCTKKTFGSVVKYCSEATERGLCEHGDETMICHCPQRDLAGYVSLTQVGTCQTDQDCEDALYLKFGSETGFRCATCLKSFIAGQEVSWTNVCTRPQDKSPTNGKAIFYCDPFYSDICSCGQVRPKIIPGGTQQSLLLAPPPPDQHVVGEAGENNNNLFASAFDRSPPASEGGLDGGSGVVAGGGEMPSQGGGKDVGFVPMGNVGDWGVTGTG